MNGEVRRLKEKEEPKPVVQFTDLAEGEGAVIEGMPNNMDGLRIRISANQYLHFDTRGKVFINTSFYWPAEIKEPVKKFKLIAEEI